MYTLFARAGWGSVLVETQLAWYGLDYELEEVGDLLRSQEARAALVQVNKLAQIPTLLLPDGTVMTESAAITLHLADVTGRSDLVPPPHGLERPAFLRWLVFTVANLYPTFTYADIPGRFVPGEQAQEEFRANVDAYAQRLWRQIDEAAGAPWFLGERFSAMDIFVTGISRWRPGRAWFPANCPRIAAIAAATEARPELAAVWQRNFPPE
jgi:GST-like protein